MERKMEEEITIEGYPDKIEDIGKLYDKALKGDIPGLRRFYHNKPDDALFDQITASRDTVFHIAASRGNKQVIQALLRMVPSPMRLELLKLKNLHGNTILHEIATTPNVEVADYLVTKLLSSKGSSTVTNEQDVGEIRKQVLGDRNNLGETPLFRAAESGNTEMVKFLLHEVKKVGDLHEHYRRDDGVTILHSAVIGQHFETAIWLLDKDPQFATYKDNNGKTVFHLLAGMPTAFRSTSSMNKLQAFIYYCFPSHPHDDNEAGQLSSSQINDLETGKQSKISQHGSSFLQRYIDSKMNHKICSFLAIRWGTLDRIWTKKKTHALAVTLAGKLVKTDSSWCVAHKPEEDGKICLEREEKEEAETKTEEGIITTNTSSSKKRSKSPDTPLLIAATAGIMEIVMLILNVYPQAVEHVSQNGRNILHVLILHRKFNIYEHLKEEKEEATKRLVLGIDNDGSTILHHAANTKYYHGGIKPTPALQLQEELTWFKNVEKVIPHPYTLHRNKDNYTAKELFNQEHKEQLKSAQDWVKNTCQSSSTVAILVATVVFAAAYTAPGGFHTDNGRPILLDKEKPLYSFFTVMDIAGLASSLTSVVVFLSILTSSLELEEFSRTIPWKVSIGFTFLFFSVTATMLTFTATIFLLVQLEKRWTTSLTYAAALLPIFVFALFQFPLYYQYFRITVKGIFQLTKKILPGI
ncbi:hypothetical protein COLO4_31840 [Corchorus olitorius]|uniref:PGG domain-containing protein n=1 Tax=Corchorus olitorius TaxID=93759 RepID=A0A1R3H375_9ROSI|nr:hypothetical protein COLO4_31840 [Corchorus olitorius]